MSPSPRRRSDPVPPAAAGAAETLEDDPGFPRSLARGRAYVYVLGCRDDSVFKIGFSRDPLQRFRTLHARFFEFFDLDGGVLIETERVAQARRLERELHARFRVHQAPAPVIVPIMAAGHTEWFRGVLDEAVAAARTLAAEHAFAPQAPAAWLASVLAQRKDLLFGWATRMFDLLEYAENNQDAAAARICARDLCDALDAFRSVGIHPYVSLPPAVVRWHRALVEGASSDAASDDGLGP
jgi:hypothetical protein